MSETTTTTDRSRLSWGTVALVLLLCAFWGGNTVAIKVSLADVPPLGAAGLRFLLGTAAIGLWCWRNGIPLALRPGEVRPLVGLTGIFLAQIAALNFGTKATLASQATVLISSYPLFVGLLAHFLVSGDRLTWHKSLGLALAFGGVFCVFAEPWFQSGPGHWLGNLTVAVSAFLLGLRLVCLKLLVRDLNPYQAIFWQGLLSLPAFFLASGFGEGFAAYHFTVPAVGALLYQGLVVAGFCFVAWAVLLQHHRPSQLASFSFTSPLFGVALSCLLLDDPLTGGLGLGVLLVAAGIYLANREK
jgi:drug/metabolite transporter (DMT)-like permease